MFGRTIFGAVSLAALLAATLSFAEPAHAQLVATDPSNNSVLIDLGAIDGGRAPSYGTIGAGSRFSGTAPGIGGGQLLMPPQAAPSSRLMGPDGRALRDAALPRADREPRAAAPRVTQPKAAKAPAQKRTETRTAAVQPQAQPQTQSQAKAEPKAEAAKPALPPVSLPTLPTPAPAVKSEPQPQTKAPAPAAKADGAPTPLETPTPPPAVAPAPVPDIPPMQLVGPSSNGPAAPKAEQQAAVSPQATVAPAPTPAPQAKAAPAPAPQAKSEAKATPAPQPSKGPTPAPQIASAPPPDAPSVAPSAAPSAPAAKSQPAPQQQAALPPATKGPAGKGATPQGMEILFAAGDANLSDAAKASLDKLADSLKGDEKSRLQLLAYANEDQASPSKSRRLSLSRALAVRSHLIAKGIRSTRIDVRALGDQIPSGEPNRVDLQITDR